MNTEAKEIDLPELKASKGEGNPLLPGTQALPFLGSLKVKVTARLGDADVSVAELMGLKTGATLALDRLIDQPIDLLAEGHVIAQGTLVAVGDHFGVRITTPPKAA